MYEQLYSKDYYISNNGTTNICDQTRTEVMWQLGLDKKTPHSSFIKSIQLLFFLKLGIFVLKNY